VRPFLTAYHDDHPKDDDQRRKELWQVAGRGILDKASQKNTSVFFFALPQSDLAVPNGTGA
jgi:hypothetical protein